MGNQTVDTRANRPNSGDTTHPCPGACGQQVGRLLLACNRCWARLPVDMRQAIGAAYKRLSQAADREQARVTHREAVIAAYRWYRENGAVPLNLRCPAPGCMARLAGRYLVGCVEHTARLMSRSPVLWSALSRESVKADDIAPERYQADLVPNHAAPTWQRARGAAMTWLRKL